MYCGMALACLSLFVSYALWVVQGCMPFLPCISDLAGGQSGTLFMWGVTFAALLLMPTWFDYYYMLKVDLNTEGCHWICFHKLLLAFGVYVSLCIIGVALNPWDERMVLHLLCASGLFCGGGVFLAIDTFLAYGHGGPFKQVLCITFLGFCAGVSMCVFIVIGFIELSNSGENIDMGMMRTNFLGYCTGIPGSLHRNANFNVAALFEWTLFALGFGTIGARMHAALCAWSPSTDVARAPGANVLLRAV